MKGLHLRSLTGDLTKVSSEFDVCPAKAVADVADKLNYCMPYISEYYGTFSFLEDYYSLSLWQLHNFSFDDVCKLYFSKSTYSMDESVQKLFEKRANYKILLKILSSMWRWGRGHTSWNEIVDIFHGIRNFSLRLSADFEVRLDYTSGRNEQGYTQFSRTFSDGVFAYLVYYKRNHVMTIGFSFVEGRRILIQQVQLKQSFGNRWLFKFPQARLEFVIELFMRHFPGFAVYVANGTSLCKKTIKSYESSLRRIQSRNEQRRKYISGYLHSTQEIEDNKEVNHFKCRLEHLKADTERLTAFYANCGRFVRTKEMLVSNHLAHHLIERID